jgi:hypothetical protein
LFIAERNAKINAAWLRKACGGQYIRLRYCRESTIAGTNTYVIIRAIVLPCAANSLTTSF